MTRRVLTVALSLAVTTAAHAQPTYHLVTLDPGHFHAGLVQKFMYPDVDSTVRVYAPGGDDVQQHLDRVKAFNARAEDPTHWREQLYTGADYFERMLADVSKDADRARDVVVIAGNNSRKAEYIAKLIASGLNVLGDKPMALVPADVASLKQAFAEAARKHVLLYDIMTERNEVTNALQRALASTPALFGTLRRGTPDDPAIRMESVHYLSKVVSGVQLRRPEWFFDVKAQGEGLQDVGTHLVDLVQWEAFPEQIVRERDVTVLRARRWTTPVTREQYERVTGAKTFAPFLERDVKNGALQYYSNGDVTYRIKGVNVRVQATWDFEAPPGSGDQHHSVLKGSKATLEIRQGATEKYKPTLYVRAAGATTPSQLAAAVKRAVASLQQDHPGVEAEPAGDEWRIVVPAKYDVGHEAHFAQVTSHYLSYLRAGKLPAWEVPNMITKYATLAKAYAITHGTPSASANGNASAGWVRDANTLAWANGEGAPVWRFSFDPKSGKPFFDPVTVAGGPSLTNFKPQDHPWHYGLWFSWKYINHVNYWEEDRATGQAAGFTRWSAPDIAAHDDGAATIRMHLTYARPTGEVDLAESRVIDVSAPHADGSYTIDWTMHFAAGKDGAVLDRTPMPGEPNGAVNGGYAGLSIRLAASPLAVQFSTIDGAVAEFSRDRARPNARAAAASFTLDGKPAGAVAILSDPLNTGSGAGAGTSGAPPSWYMINAPAPQDFRFLCAAILAPAAKTIPPDGALDLHYRVSVRRDEWTPDALQRAMTQWLGTRSASRG